MTKGNTDCFENKLKEVYELFNVKLFSGDLPIAHPHKWHEIQNAPFPYNDYKLEVRVKFSFLSAPKESFSMRVMVSYGEWDKTILLNALPEFLKVQLSKDREERLFEFFKHDPDCFKANKYEIIVNTSPSEFNEWVVMMGGFESTLLHEMIHIWLYEHERKYVPNLTEDWASPFWEDKNVDDFGYYYIDSIILFGELLSKSKSIDLEALCKKYAYTHRFEFFYGCYIISDLLVKRYYAPTFKERFHLDDIRRMLNIKLDKKLPTDEIFKISKDLTNELYGYTTLRHHKKDMDGLKPARIPEQAMTEDADQSR